MRQTFLTCPPDRTGKNCRNVFLSFAECVLCQGKEVRARAYRRGLLIERRCGEVVRNFAAIPGDVSRDFRLSSSLHLQKLLDLEGGVAEADLIKAAVHVINEFAVVPAAAEGPILPVRRQGIVGWRSAGQLRRTGLFETFVITEVVDVETNRRTIAGHGQLIPGFGGGRNVRIDRDALASDRAEIDAPGIGEVVFLKIKIG